MAPCYCPPPGCYPQAAERWEITNEWTGRSTLVHSSRLQPAQWSQDVWDKVMIYTGVPQYALDEFHRRCRSERRKSRSRSRGRDSSAERPLRKESRSRSRDRDRGRGRGRGRGRSYYIDPIYEGDYKDHIPSKQDFTVQPFDAEKKHSGKELKSIQKRKNSRIFFDDARGPYYALNTFSGHTVMYDGYKFPTAEHLILFFRFAEWPEIGHRLRKQPTVTKLWEEADQFTYRKSRSWRQDKVLYMEIALWHKFTQHKGLKKLILETGERPITYMSTADSFWGTGRDGNGKNQLGRALEKTRWRIKTCTPPVL